MFPPLSPTTTNPPPQKNPGNGRPNAWLSKSKKVLMNSGVGGKLEYMPTEFDRVFLKSEDAIPLQHVWGWSLLGQYVSFYPGCMAINELRKSWGVKSRFREEAEWMIF